MRENTVQVAVKSASSLKLTYFPISSMFDVHVLQKLLQLPTFYVNLTFLLLYILFTYAKSCKIQKIIFDIRYSILCHLLFTLSFKVMFNQSLIARGYFRCYSFFTFAHGGIDKSTAIARLDWILLIDEPVNRNRLQTVIGRRCFVPHQIVAFDRCVAQFMSNSCTNGIRWTE